MAAGECDVAVVNHYYLVRLIKSDEADEERAIAEKVDIVFPNQDGRGAHANISGAGVVATAPNKDNAIKFLEYLTTDQAQDYFAQGNYEFPVVEGVKLGPGPGAVGRHQDRPDQRCQLRRAQRRGGHADGPRRLEVEASARPAAGAYRSGPRCDAPRLAGPSGVEPDSAGGRGSTIRGRTRAIARLSRITGIRPTSTIASAAVEASARRSSEAKR